MKTGSPGFIGLRLKEARQARGYSASGLADQLGVTRSAVSHYERGEQSPRPEIMRKIEEVLDLPPQFFWRVPQVERDPALFWRSMSAATKQARTRAASRYSWLEEIVRYVREYVHFPLVSFPDLELPKDPAAITPDLIEELALETRRFWKLGDGAITNLVWLLENNGAIVSRTKLQANTLDAFSEWHRQEEVPYFILGADKKVAARSRSDAAHELGHIVLHRQVDRASIARNHNLIEGQASRFAGAFLLPEASFARDFFSPTLDTFQALKPKWGISIQLMIHRAQDLGLVSTETATRLWINCSRRGWRLKEPLDDQLPIEEPRLLRRAFEMLLKEGVQTRSEILSALPYPAADIEELAGLPPGFLEEQPIPLTLRRFTQGKPGNFESREQRAQVMEFKPKHR